MTLSAPILANAPAARFEFESFAEVAFNQLAACPLVEPGVCANPLCSQRFIQARSWQRYCCTTCRKMDEQEIERVGAKAAPAILAWQAGRYEKTDEALRDLSRVGRNHMSGLASAWWRHRQALAAERGGGNASY